MKVWRVIILDDWKDEASVYVIASNIKTAIDKALKIAKEKYDTITNPKLTDIVGAELEIEDLWK